MRTMYRVVPFRADAEIHDAIVQYAIDNEFISPTGKPNLSAAVYSLVSIGLQDFPGQHAARNAYILARNSALVAVREKLGRMIQQLAKEI